MTLFHALTDRQAELLSGGGDSCELPNPSSVYPCDTNYGQYKKGLEDPCLPNPSAVYPCDTNYGQYKKGLG